MSLSIQTREEEGVAILNLEGELDVASSPSLREELDRLITAGSRRIAVDMNQVTYMDSSGLGALVTAHRSMGGRGTIALVGCRANVERVLRFTQFDKVLDVYRNFEDYQQGHKDNLRAVSGVSKSVIQKQKAISKVSPQRGAERPSGPGRRLQ